MKWTRTRAASVLAVGTASALVLAACSSDPATTPSESESPEVLPTVPVTLTFGYWGNFGVEEAETGPSLESQYEESHPYVNLELNSGDYGAQHDLLTQSLLAGSGAYNIAAIDEGYITGFVAQAEGFVNLLDYGAGQYEASYLPWKWDQALTADREILIGLGSDVGGLAMCFRQDLFEAAGITTDRDEVSALIGDSWADFIELGVQYEAATGRNFVDNASNILSPALSQGGVSFYNTNNELDMDGVRPAFDIALDVIESGISANIGAWSPEWNAGFANGEFAVLACPAWMLGYIQGQIGDAEFVGTWDIADIPGDGGNWGGSFYTIPAQGSAYEQAEAYRFIEWIIQPEQQLKIMAETGNLPSQIGILESDAVSSFTNPFFNDAPYGEIFAQTVLDIPSAIYYGPNHGNVRQAVESVLNEVQAGNISLPDAWDAAVAAAEAADV